MARVVAVGLPHHVSQRGNNRERVFFDDADRRRYLRLLRGHSREFGLEVWAYCLMANHVHILAVPAHDNSLARAIGRTNLVYTQHINRRYSRSGRIWQNRFFSCPVDGDRYLWAVLRYIEANPVRAGVADVPWDYRWSSARHHALGAPDELVAGPDWVSADLRDDYRGYVRRPAAEEWQGIRRSTSSGRPLGDADFTGQLERQLGRKLASKKLRLGKPGA